MTLAFRVAPVADLSEFLGGVNPIGGVVELHAIAECRNDRVQAWLVELGGSARRRIDGGALHVTVSRREDARSGEANELLAHGARTPLSESLRGVLAWVDD